MEVKVKDIANIQFGYYGKPSVKGTLSYLQAKHFNEFGLYIGENDTFLEEDLKSIENLLQNEDILFVAKGFRFFATLYKEEHGKAVASSIFFILRTDKTRIIPAYLVSVLNLPKNLLHFQQSGAGSTIPSIRKNELADFTFNLIPLEEQQKIVALQELYLKDIELTNSLIKEKQKLFQTTISTIIK
ncbi:restriction endonuclease subunit S [Flavobacterium sp. IB48]|uniref:restriction endonuclease subunit S n=1 Tax=Flavobacterium sp. IB48 TaxID=2779375 RepID=UPI0018E893D2|nr:restriction endonuclease subunit S [Flavobacterium sp. IB48]MBJ2126309.1 restriction endonuclease subunit S [Flavobacterium sp. IB48]